MSYRAILWPLSVGLAFVAGTMVPIEHSSTLRAQSAQTNFPKFVQVDYMKLQRGREADYLRLEQETWKPLHQERVKKGQLRSWAFYEVRFPSGTEEKFDYVTLNTFDKFAQLEEPYADYAKLFSTIHPNKKTSDILQETEAARQVVRSEVWQLIDQTR